MDIKKCPFCGASPIIDYTAGRVDRLARYQIRVRVGCPDCEMVLRKTIFCEEPTDLEVKCAINMLVDKWNRRV